MELTETQQVLFTLLMNLRLSKDTTKGVMLLLNEKEEQMEKMAIYLYDEKPTEAQVIQMAVRLAMQQL